MGAGVAEIAQAVEDSETVKLNEDKTAIKRLAELPEHDHITTRSIYAVQPDKSHRIERLGQGQGLHRVYLGILHKQRLHRVVRPSSPLP